MWAEWEKEKRRRATGTHPAVMPEEKKGESEEEKEVSRGKKARKEGTTRTETRVEVVDE